MWKPAYTLGALLIVGLACSLISLTMPADGLPIADDFTLRFPAWQKDLKADSVAAISIGDVEDYLDSFDVEVDSVALQDSIAAIEAAHRQALMRIQFAHNDASHLHPFFEAIDRRSGSEKIRVLHYGDSQIEGDRISGYVRNAMQNKWGGNGPGMLPAFEVIPTLAIKQNASENWKRHTRYGRKDPSVEHTFYGTLMTFSRFTPSVPDSLIGDSIVEAWFGYKPNRSTYNRNKKYTQAHLWFGNNKLPFHLRVTKAGEEIYNQQVSATGPNGHLTFNLGGTPEELMFHFTGAHSPDIYGVSLEGGGGIYLDNIGMRGSSGTIFKKVDKGQLTAQYSAMDVELIILQFGGNYVPHIKNMEAAKRYGKWFESQIRYLQSIAPNASFVLIGPSDMAYKKGTDFVTRPYLEEVRDALKTAAYKTDCGFWDIYEVMGGRNSMVSWVNSDPKLAGDDHTHFTPKGARRIAELFARAIELEYDAWKGTNEPIPTPVEGAPPTPAAAK